jgi:NADH-quinone oxidoreductase subunit J
MSDNETGSRGQLVPAAAVGLLFAVMVVTVRSAEFGTEAAGFPEDASVVHNIGYALFNLGEYGVATIPSEGFLAAFLIAAVALDVAVDGAVYLAKREQGGSIVSAVGHAFTDGGRDGGER